MLKHNLEDPNIIFAIEWMVFLMPLPCVMGDCCGLLDMSSDTMEGSQDFPEEIRGAGGFFV